MSPIAQFTPQWHTLQMDDLKRPPTSKKAIGIRLELTRLALGMKPGDFASRAGIAKSTYSNYASGAREPDLALALKLCNTYELTLDWIYRGDPSGLKYALANKINKLRQERNRLS